MRVLIGYAANALLRDDLKAAFAIQMGLFPKEWSKYDVFVGGITIPGLPSVNVDSPEIATARNACIQYAQDSGYEWVLLNDVDGIIMSTPERLPASGFATVPTVLGRQGELPHVPSDATRWTNGVFLIHRRFFNRRFHPGYKDYGFEDTDFERIVMRGVPKQATSISAFHLWHKPRYPGINRSNEKIYDQRLSASDCEPVTPLHR